MCKKGGDSMKKRLILLFAVIMLLSSMCMPVMAQNTKASAPVTAKAVKSGWTKVGTNWRFYVNGVVKKNGVFKINNQLFGFNAQGNLQKGFFKIGNKTYFASTKFGPASKAEIKYGIVLTGYFKIGDAYYYFDPSQKGMMKTGMVKIGKSLYYFDPSNGKQYRKKGWFYVNSSMYYVKADGTIATNTTIDGIHIGPNGAVIDPFGMDRVARGRDSYTRYLILVSKSHHRVNIYKGSKGNWICIRRNIPCTIGKSSTPTKSGNFMLSIRSERAYGYKDFKGATAFYATRINAGNFFHSILYKLGSRNPATAKIKDAKLGQNKSNSCVRLPLDDAKFIWTSMPYRTRTYIY